MKRTASAGGTDTDMNAPQLNYAGLGSEPKDYDRIVRGGNSETHGV